MAKKQAMTTVQELAVQKVEAATLYRRDLLAKINAEQRAERARRLNAADLSEAIAVRDALSTNVVKARIQEALGTSNPHAIKAVLSRLDGVADTGPAFNPAFSWADSQHQQIAIRFPGFPTSSLAEDYPATLAGVVRRDESHRNGYEVISDESDEETGFGTVPGHLRWEINEAEATLPGSLVERLNEWTAANS